MNAIARIHLVCSLTAAVAACAPTLAHAFWQRKIVKESVEPVPARELVDEDTGDVIAPPDQMLPDNAPTRGSWTLTKQFDDIVFLGEGNTAQVVVARLEKDLQLKVERLALDCRLSDVQKSRLLLAGRGDIKRLIDRIHAERNPFEGINSRDAGPALRQKSLDVARLLRNTIVIGPFGDGSILAKVARSDLAPEHFEAYVVAEEVVRWGGKISTIVRGNIEFREVTIPGIVFNDGRLARLSALPKLTRLTAELTNVTNEGLASLTRLTNLETLDLSRTRISSPGMVHLSGLKNLQVLLLRNTVVGDEGLEPLGKVSGLRELHLQGTPITDAGLVHLKGLERLELLNLGRTRVTDAGLIELDLPSLAHLKDLGLSNTNIGEAGFALIGNCAALERLVIIGTRVTDSSLHHLRKLKNLKNLVMDQTKITDEGLAVIAEIAGLEALELSNTPVGDVGLIGLRKLEKLKYLNVVNTRVTDDGISELNRALPDLVVSH